MLHVILSFCVIVQARTMFFGFSCVIYTYQEEVHVLLACLAFCTFISCVLQTKTLQILTSKQMEVLEWRHIRALSALRTLQCIMWLAETVELSAIARNLVQSTKCTVSFNKIDLRIRWFEHNTMRSVLFLMFVTLTLFRNISFSS